MSKVHITTHDGKLKGIRSISTSMLMNEGCKERSKIAGSICSECYAGPLIEMRKGLRKNLEENQKLLTSRILDDEELPVIEDEIFRFSSFSDLNNEIELINYLNIVKKNPSTTFTIWTKRTDIVAAYFNKVKEVPENFILIVSSLFVNKEFSQLDVFKSMTDDKGNRIFKDDQLKIFTVYDHKFLKEHPEVDINCGSRNCLGCKKCYTKNLTTHINEILKKDQNRVETMDMLRRPEKRKKSLNDLLSMFGYHKKEETTDEKEVTK